MSGSKANIKLVVFTAIALIGAGVAVSGAFSLYREGLEKEQWTAFLEKNKCWVVKVTVPKQPSSFLDTANPANTTYLCSRGVVYERNGTP